MLICKGRDYIFPPRMYMLCTRYVHDVHDVYVMYTCMYMLSTRACTRYVHVYVHVCTWGVRTYMHVRGIRICTLYAYVCAHTTLGLSTTSCLASTSGLSW